MSKSNQCLICLGDARLPLKDRLSHYCSKYLLKRHFHRKHPKFECDSPCPDPDYQRAKVNLLSGIDFMNHAAMVHHIDIDARTWSNQTRWMAS